MFQNIITLAAQLPTGLTDPRAVEKLHRERAELQEFLDEGDIIGAILEAGDCVYYAAKALHNRLITVNDAAVIVQTVAPLVGLDIGQVIGVAETKYALRARPGNPKDDAAERAAVAAYLARMKRK